MTRAEYFKKQRDLTRAAARTEAEAVRRIRAATRELVIPLVKQYAEQGTIIYPKEELARQIDHIIREEGAKPVMAARKLQEDMEASLAEKLGIKIKQRQELNSKKKNERIPRTTRKPVGETIVLPGRSWGYGMSSKGLASYYRDPETGKIVWTDLPLEYQFSKRADLSTLVWKAVEEQEQMVLDVIQGGRSLGRNVKDISGDLEQFINYPNGGERVVGRWMGMFPNTEAGRKEAWQREYLAAHGGLQPGSDAAKDLLRQSDAREWVKQKMDETTKRGTPRLPAAVKQYATRLGKAGLDYRTIRIARTETTAMLADEQTAIAENSDIATGEMDFVMERGRDHWNCNCEHYAEQNPWDVDDPERPEIPVHPNCMCQWRPRLKSDDEILAAFKEEMAEDLETIQGTQEQADFLADIDRQLEGEDTREGSPIFSQPDSSGRNDDSPPKFIERSPDYSMMSFNEAIKSEFDYLQKMTKKTGNEYMSILTNGKKVAGTWEGGPKNINSDENMLNILDKSPDNSLNLLHTHTRNVGFSGKDLGTMCDYTSVNGVNAKCPDGSEYYASIGPKGKRPSSDEVVEFANKEARKLLHQPRYTNMKPGDVRWAALIRERNETIRKEYKWDLR